MHTKVASELWQIDGLMQSRSHSLALDVDPLTPSHQNDSLYVVSVVHSIGL